MTNTTENSRGKNGFLKTSLIELLLAGKLFLGGDGKDASGKEGAFARFMKTKLHFLTREDEVKMGAFVAKSVEEKDRRKYDSFQRALATRGYDTGFFRVNFSNMLKEDYAAAEIAMQEFLTTSNWNKREASLARYYLLKKKGIFLKIWENRWYLLFLIVTFLYFFGVLLNTIQ